MSHPESLHVILRPKLLGKIALTDVSLLTVLSIINWIHLLATVAWIGGMTTNTLILLPSIRETLEPATAGRFLGAVMKRFRLLVYASIILLLFSGAVVTGLHGNYLELLQTGNSWAQVILIKHVFAAALIVLAVYAFEVLAPKVARMGVRGPSPELVRLQKLQSRLATAGLMIGLIILLLAAIATTISA